MEIVGISMQEKLSESLNTYLQSSKKNVSTLIRDMKIDKIDFKALMGKLSSVDSLGAFQNPGVKELSILTRENILELFRGSSLRINQLFVSANAAGMILDSMVNIFSAEIDKLEKELDNFQIFIDNYEFIAGKDDLYNANYVEKFDNSLSDYRADNYNFTVPDRDFSSFPEGGNIFIDTFTGTMKIGSGQNTLNLLDNIKSIKQVDNFSNFVTSSSNFINVFTPTLNDSWSTTIKSNTILTSNLSDYLKFIPYDDSGINGARVAVEMELYIPVEMDTIRFSPTLGNGFSLLQVVIYNSVISPSSGVNPSSSYQLLLNAPKTIDRDVQIGFEATLVSKIIFIFNQSSYTRTKTTPITSEQNSKALNSFVENRLEENRTSFSRNQDIAYWHFKNKYLIEGIKKNKSQDVQYYSYRFPHEIFSYENMIENEIYKASTLEVQDRPNFTNSPLFAGLIRSMLSALNMDDKFFETNFYIQSASNSTFKFLNSPGFIPYKGTNVNDSVKHQYYKDNVGIGNASLTIKDLLLNESLDSYEYSFSIKSISFIKTNNASNDRACFVSRKLPVDGQVAAIKAKLHTIDQNAVISADSYDLKKYGSYELSISNVDSPVSENNWIPLAFNNQTYIDSEVVFFDHINFFAKLRFFPRSDSIILFKNGKALSPDSYIYRNNSQRLELLDRSLYSATDIFCAQYELDSSLVNPFELDLIKNFEYKEAITQFKTSDGLGEPFTQTSSSASVTLSYVPYVNKSFISNVKYDKYYGTIFSNVGYGYSPVKVKLSDGSYAVNITNYTSTPQQVQFQSLNSVQFIQNGRNIIFNRVISSGFTVEYEYVPHNLRFRLIIRKNIPGLDVPSMVDSVLLKMKTVYFDPYYDKLSYMSTIN